MSDFEVLQERLNSLKNENDIVHEQLAQQIKNVSQMLIEERKRTNGSLDKLGLEMQKIRESLEEKISNLTKNINELRTQVSVLVYSKPDWKNSYIVTFLSTLCGILMTYVVTKNLLIR